MPLSQSEFDPIQRNPESPEPQSRSDAPLPRGESESPQQQSKSNAPLSQSEIRIRILQELYRQARGGSKPVDVIALAAKVGIPWADASTQVIALRKEGLIEQLELTWSIMLTDEGRRRSGTSYR